MELVIPFLVAMALLSWWDNRHDPKPPPTDADLDAIIFQDAPRY